MSDQCDPFEDVTVHCETARDFLQELDETHERWGDQEPWIYRGHNDANWELKPSLYRLLNEQDEDDFGRYKSFEITLIRRFINDVNLANLPIPSNSFGFLSRTKDNGVVTHRWALDPYGDEIVYDFTHVVFAIAQHSGVPTRLLSFTFDPLVAAYFAADLNNLAAQLELSSEWKENYLHEMLMLFSNSVEPKDILERFLNMILEKQKKLPKHMSVWAIREWDLQMQTSLRILHHPNSEIINLKSQKGVFVCDIGADNRDDKFFQSFDKQLSGLIDSKGIYKITLPFSELESLRSLLGKKGRYPAIVIPSYKLIAGWSFEQIQNLRQRGKRQRVTVSEHDVL